MRHVNYLNCYHYRPNQRAERSLVRDVLDLVLWSSLAWLWLCTAWVMI